MNNKRGSHVGMMVSFMIFITFVVFFLSMLTTRVNKNKDETSTLKYIEMRILKNTSYPITTALINITKESEDSTCIELKDLFIYLNSTSYGGVIKDHLNNLQESYVNNEEFQTSLKINRSNPEESFLKVLLSPALNNFEPNDEITCTTKANPEGYRFLSIRKDVFYNFESEFERLNESYFNDYSALKEELFVPSENEFTFEFNNSNGYVIKPSKELIGKNIYSDEIPIQYIDDNGDIQSGFLKVKIA